MRICIDRRKDKDVLYPLKGGKLIGNFYIEVGSPLRGAVCCALCQNGACQSRQRGGPRSRSARDPHLSRVEIIVRLAAAPRRIAAATAAVPNSRLRAVPAPGAWSIVDILAHLRASADVWGGAIDQILSARRPTFKAISPYTWLKQTDYRSQDFSVLLRAYTRQRTALVRQLQALPARAWERSAIVTGCGAPLERTLTWYALGIAAHEHSHLKHIERLMSERG